MRRIVRQKLILGTLIAVLLSLYGQSATAATRLQDIRIWAGPESTRVVFDLSSTVRHELRVLENPHRLVIDVANATRPDAFAGARPGKGLVRSVRTGIHGNSVRVVLDLVAKVEPQSFILPPSAGYGHRLVVDLNEPRPKPGVWQPAPAAQPPVVTAQRPAPPAVATSPANPAPAAPATQTSRAPASIPTPVPGPEIKPLYKPVVIAIDAGHGGEDSGARGPSGSKEKHIALAISKKLAAKINAQPGMRAVLIRTGDYYIGLRRRTEKAREHQADLFVSIHADAFTDRRAHGSSVFVLSQRGASSEYARALADRENKSDLVGGVQLSGNSDRDSFLLSVLQDTSMEASFDAGDRILKEMGKINRLHKKTVQQAGFVVLKSPDIPSILVETAFISNRKEEKNLRSSVHQHKIANSIMRGIKSYFGSYRPAQTVAQSSGGALTAGANLQHEVRRGDSLTEIAQTYNVPVSRIRASNNLSGNLIKVGQVLSIPQ